MMAFPVALAWLIGIAVADIAGWWFLIHHWR